MLAVLKMPCVPWLIHVLELELWERSGADLLVGDEDLEATDNLCERNAGVLLPLLNGLNAVNEDNKVLGLALVVDLSLSSVATSHDDCRDWSMRSI